MYICCCKSRVISICVALLSTPLVSDFQNFHHFAHKSRLVDLKELTSECTAFKCEEVMIRKAKAYSTSKSVFRYKEVRRLLLEPCKYI